MPPLPTPSPLPPFPPRSALLAKLNPNKTKEACDRCVHAQHTALEAEADLVAATSTSLRECGSANQLAQSVMQTEVSLTRTEAQLILARENVTAAARAIRRVDTVITAVKTLMVTPLYPTVLAQFDDKISMLPVKLKARLPLDSHTAAASALETLKVAFRSATAELELASKSKKRQATAEHTAAQASIDHLDAESFRLNATLAQERDQASAQAGQCTVAQTSVDDKSKRATLTLQHVSQSCAGFELTKVAPTTLQAAA